MNDLLIKNVAMDFSLACGKIYGQKLNSVILFGSCARGDYSQDSDIDIMILIETEQGELTGVQWNVIDIANKLGLEYDVVISPVVESKKVFDKYLPASGFFQSIMKDGIKIA